MPALIATISGNAVPLQRTLKDVENAARRAGMVVQKNLSHGGVNSGAMREFLVLLREIGRGNWSRVPGSLSILASRLNLLKLLFNPVTIGLVAFGTAAFFVVRHVFKLSEATKNWNDLMDTTRTKFSLQAEAMKQAALHAQAFNDWLRSLGRSEDGLAEATERALKALREKAKFERELAAEKGASKKTLAQMDIKEVQDELAIVNRSLEEAKKRVARDKVASQRAFSNANNPNAKSHIETIEEQRKEAAKVIDALQEKMRHPISDLVSDPMAGDLGIGAGPSRAANKNDVFDVEVGGKQFHMSMAEAQKRFQELQSKEIRLAKIEKELADLAEKKKSLTEKDVGQMKKLQEEKRTLEADLKLKQQFLPQIAENADGHLSMHLSNLQQQGAYGGRAVLIDIHRKQLHELVKIHTAVTRGGSGGGPLGGANFGGRGG